MSIDTSFLVDGRQSPEALSVQRGVCRVLRNWRFVAVSELALSTGRRADLVGLGPKGELWIVEIKSSVADFRADQKWPDYRDHCDRFFFAVPRAFPLDILPEETGLIIADQYGGEIIREAPEHRLNAARRKQVLIRFARAGAHRLDGLVEAGAEVTLGDPDQ